MSKPNSGVGHGAHTELPQVRCGWLTIGDGTEIPVQIIEKKAIRVLIEAFQATPVPMRGVVLERQERLWVESYQISNYFMAFVEAMRTVEHKP